MQHILVASDLSERSDRALSRGVRLSRLLGLPLRAITIVDEDLPPPVRERRLSEARAWLARTLEDAGGNAADAVAITGDPAATIPAEALHLKAALLVLGLHRPRAVLDSLRETTMERIARNLHAPLLLARQDAPSDYARVLVPVSFTPACAAALAAARHFAPGARLRAFHALHLPFAGVTGEVGDGPMGRALRAETAVVAEAWRRANGLTAESGEVAIVPGSLGEALDHETIATAPDLLALGVHARGVMAAHGLGGTTAALVRNPPCDLLIVPHRPPAM